MYFVNYDFKDDATYVPDGDFNAIRNASCAADAPRHLPMDGPDNSESFEMQLRIDQKVREAINRKNDQVLEHVKELRERKRR